MVSVISAQLVLVLIVLSAVLVILVEMLNIFFLKNELLLSERISFVKWVGLTMLFVLVLDSSWSWISSPDREILMKEGQANCSFWLFDFLVLTAGLLFSQLLWLKAIITSKIGRLVWAIVVLIIVFFTPFVDVLMNEHLNWIQNESSFYLDKMNRPSDENVAGITITSSSNLYLPSVLLFLVVNAVGLLLSRKFNARN